MLKKNVHASIQKISSHLYLAKQEVLIDDGENVDQTEGKRHQSLSLQIPIMGPDHK